MSDNAVYIGYAADHELRTYNFAIGYGAMADMKVGSRCCALGANALGQHPYVCDDCGRTSDDNPDDWFGINLGPYVGTWCVDCKGNHVDKGALTAIVDHMKLTVFGR